MASFLYNSLITDLINGDVDFSSDTFYVMLVTSTYSPDKDTDAKRSDVTNEVSGTGYTAGGVETVASVGALDTANDRVNISFGNAVFGVVDGFTAKAGVVYKRRGGASSADELVAYADFTEYVADGSSLSLSFSTPLRITA